MNSKIDEVFNLILKYACEIYVGKSFNTYYTFAGVVCIQDNIAKIKICFIDAENNELASDYIYLPEVKQASSIILNKKFDKKKKLYELLNLYKSKNYNHKNIVKNIIRNIELGAN